MQVEEELRFPDGSTRWHSVWLVRLDQPSEEVTSVLGIARDISATKRAQRALIESRERFKLIAESIEEVFWMADTILGTMFYVSPSYERIFGRTVRSLYEQPTSFIDAIHPDDRDRVVAEIREREALSQPFDHEYRILHPDGTVRWIWDRGFPVPGEGGEINRYRGDRP